MIYRSSPQKYYVNENTYANGKYYLQKWHINSKFYEKIRQLVG